MNVILSVLNKHDVVYYIVQMLLAYNNESVRDVLSFC